MTRRGFHHSASRAQRLGVCLLAALTGCGQQTMVQPTEWVAADGYRYRELAVQGGKPGFSRVEDTGLDFVNLLSDAAIVQNRHRMNGSGVAVGDVDGDSRPDIFFAAMESAPRLYRNLGDWHFADATQDAGLSGAPNWSTGAVLADVDGDSDLDLFLTVLTAPNVLYLNDGLGHFRVATGAGLGSNRGSMSASFADTDQDGDLDLYVANYKRMALRDSLSPELLLLDAITDDDGAVLPSLREHYRVAEVGGRPIRLELGEEDQYYLNQGDGTFQPAAIPGVGRDWGLGARMQDVSGDGIPDLYVANDFESPDYFLTGDGKGGWTDQRNVLGHTSNSSMSVGMADVNRDGRIDIFVPDMLSPDPVRSRFEAGTAAPQMTAGADSRPQYMQNSLFLARDSGVWVEDEWRARDYAESAWAYGVAATGWSWSGIFLDVDLDGWEDLLISTGHSFAVQDVDAQTREREAIRRVRSVEAFRSLITDYPTLELENVALRNLGGQGFEAVPGGWGIGVGPDITHGMALGDFDGDGDMDVVTNRMNLPAGLYRNDGGADRVALRFRLDGSPGINPAGIGLTVSLGNQQREVVAGGHYLSSSQAQVTFASAPGNLTVSRGDEFVEITDTRPNRLYEITALDFKQKQPTLSQQQVLPVPPTRITVEREAVQREASPLHDPTGKTSGPVWFDADGDGDQDYAEAAEWGAIRLFLSDGAGGFSEATGAWGLSAYTGLWRALAAGDVDGDGATDLVAANWGWNSRLGRIGDTASRARGPARGLRLYSHDFDGDGRENRIEAEYREDLNGWSPIADFFSLRTDMPFLSRRVSSFHAFAESTVEDLVGDSGLILEASTLASTVFLNRGDHFEAVVLPLEAQLAPGNAVLVLESAGQSDIFIAQNAFCSGGERFARQDAGRGLRLRWTADGWLVRGLRVFGEQSDVAEVDGRIVLSLRSSGGCILDPQ